MPAANSMAMKRETLNLRIRPAERDLIDRAAKARGKTALTLCWRPPRRGGRGADRAAYHYGRSGGLSDVSYPP